MRFNATTSIIQNTGATILGSSNRFSLVVWLRALSAGEGGQGRVFVLDETGNALSLLINASVNIRFTRVFSGGSSNHDVGSGAWTSGQWFCYALSYDGSSGSNAPTIWTAIPALTGGLTLRTPSSATTTGTPTAPNTGFAIGNRAAGNRTWDGDIAFLQVFNRAITYAEAQACMLNPGSIRKDRVLYAPLIDHPWVFDSNGRKFANSTVTAISKNGGPMGVRERIEWLGDYRGLGEFVPPPTPILIGRSRRTPIHPGYGPFRLAMFSRSRRNFQPSYSIPIEHFFGISATATASGSLNFNSSRLITIAAGIISSALVSLSSSRFISISASVSLAGSMAFILVSMISILGGISASGLISSLATHVITISAVASLAASIGSISSRLQTIAAGINATASILVQRAYLFSIAASCTLAASLAFSSVVIYYLTIPAAATMVASISLLALRYRSILASVTASPSIGLLLSLSRSISGQIVANPVVSRGLSLSMSIAASAILTPSVALRRSFLRGLAASVSALSSLVSLFIPGGVPTPPEKDRILIGDAFLSRIVVKDGFK